MERVLPQVKTIRQHASLAGAASTVGRKSNVARGVALQKLLSELVVLETTAKFVPRSIKRACEELQLLHRTLGLCGLFMIRFGTTFLSVSPCKCRFPLRNAVCVSLAPGR